MSITRHTTSQMMQAYVKFDQTAKQKFMDKLDGIEKDPVLAVLHLAVFLWNTKGAVAAGPHIDLLQSEYLDQFYYLMATTRQYKTQL